MIKLIFIGTASIFALFNIASSVKIECDCKTYSFAFRKGIYSCQVKNINSPEKAQIESLTNNHISGKTSNDEIFFYCPYKNIQHFPRGLEKFYGNIRGILIFGHNLKEVHQRDLEPFSKLEYFQIHSSKFEIIEEGLFDFNPNLEVIIFHSCNIFHIHPTVFDNLSKLNSLLLNNNLCVSQDAHENQEKVKELIISVKSECNSQSYSKLDSQLKNIELTSKHLNPANFPDFSQNLKSFEDEFKVSKFASFSPLNERFESLKSLKISDFTTTTTVRTNYEQCTTPKPVICPKIEQPLCLNCSKIEDFQSQVKISFKNLISSIEDIRISQADTLSMLDHKFPDFGSKFLNFDEKVTKFEEKMTNFYEKITNFDDKVDNIENSLELMRQKIEKLEKSLTEKIDKNFAKILKALKIEI